MTPREEFDPIPEIFGLGHTEGGVHVDFLLNPDEVYMSVDRRGVSHKDSGPEGGRFVPRGQEGGPPPVSKERQRKRNFAKKRGEVTDKVKEVAGEVGQKSLRALIEAGKKAGAAEHYASEWVGEKVEGLPAALRIPLKALYYAGFGTFIAGQKAARAVATQVGGEDHGRRVGAILATIDNTAAVGAKVAGLAGVHGGEAALVLPVASATYLAYAGVRHPVATVKAAAGGVKKALEKMRGKNDKEKGRGESYPEIVKHGETYLGSKIPRAKPEVISQIYDVIKRTIGSDDKAEVQVYEVPINKIEGTQESVLKDRVAHYRGKPKTSTPARGYWYKGKVYLTDGTHRAVAADLDGLDSIDVQLIDVDSLAERNQ